MVGCLARSLSFWMDQLQPGKSNLVVCSCSDLWSFVLALLGRQRHFLLAFSQKESHKTLADEATQDDEKRHHLVGILRLGSARLCQGTGKISSSSRQIHD